MICCMFFKIVEIIGNGGVDMKNKIIKLVGKQGFIIFLFVCVCVVAGGTLYLSVRNLNIAEEKIRDDNFEVVESENADKSSDYDSLNAKDLEDIQLGINVPDEDLLGLEESELKEGQEQVGLEESELEEVKQEVDEKLKEKIQEDAVAVEKTEIQEASKQSKVEATQKSPKPQQNTSKEKGSEEVVAVIGENQEDILKDNKADLVEDKPLIMPVQGKVITEYTHDTLVFSKTLDAFVGHAAIDVLASEGTTVIAPMDGTIKDVYEDDLYGIVIIIDHGNGLETKYANLQTKQMVKKGTKVAKGDHISKVGKSAKIEMHLEPHLHFEVKKDGKLIDPRSIIK